MQKGFVKYYLTLFILLFSGYSYLSATSSDLTESRDTRVNGAHRYRDYSFNASLSTSHKIDFAENEIEEEDEDESSLHIRSFESLNYSPDFSSQSVGRFARENKDIPFYLIFCTIRI